jgi:hypothetical protein
VSSSVGGTLDLSIGVPAVALAFVYLTKVVSLVVYMKFHKVRISVSYGLLFGGVIAFLVFRIVTWMLWMTLTNSVADAVFNRLAWILGAVVLILLLVSWMDAVHSQYSHGTERFMFWLKISIVAFTIAYALSTIIPMIIYFASRVGVLPSPSSTARSAYDASIWTHVGVQLVLSLAFLGYGIAIVALILKANPGEKRQIVSVISVALAIVIAYASQFSVFLIRPLGGCIPAWFFWTFAYILPSCLISLVVLYLGLEYAQKEIRVMERVRQAPSQVPLLEIPKMYDNI